ncbi:hypothetical protein GEV33_004057 [Tenebrio molitor]|uniref:Uncharacterized protein n=1 Tax=Tenebrio molitor TaxID=7067 RepID=A0A8J6HQ96_TENMO|nr:hypothetical protein GEV33_004057 [Tenebrio molitor]
MKQSDSESEKDEDHKRKREEGRESEERINPFRKSKKVERSPVKKAMDEEMKEMLEKIMEDVGEIKEENRKMSRELEQLKSMMREKEEKWEREKMELKEKMKKIEGENGRAGKKSEKKEYCCNGTGRRGIEGKQERESERWDNNGCEKGLEEENGTEAKEERGFMERTQKYERNEENNRRATKRAGRRNFGDWGDFHARIGGKGRRMEEEQGTIERRPTEDGIENAGGRELVSLVEERGWDVLNGNCIGDEKREYTYIRPRGETVIDYVMVNEEAWDEIGEFKVGERVESDHMPLEVRTKGREKERGKCREGKQAARKKLRNWKKEKATKEEYKRARKRYKLVCKEKKEKKRMEEEMKMKGIKTEEEVWRYTNRERKKKGEIVSDRITMEEWRKHFSELLGGEEIRQEKEKRQHRVGEIEEITREELEQQLRKLKRKKAPGRDGIQNESWIYGTEREVHRLLEIMNGKGEKDTASKYRGITLLNTTYEVYAMIVEERLMKEMNERGVLPDGQAGFRKDRGTMDNVYILNHLKPAFDNVDVHGMEKYMRREKLTVNVEKSKMMVFRKGKDSLLKSVMMYGAEIWGWREQEGLEGVQGKYLKWVLGVDRETPGYIVMEETKRDGIRIEAGKRAIRFEERVIKRGECRILQECLKEKRKEIGKGVWKDREAYFERNVYAGAEIERMREGGRAMTDELVQRDRDAQVHERRTRIRESRLPPYNPELNPIEKIWALVKNHVAAYNTTFKLDDVRKLAEAKFEAVTVQQWQNICSHVEKIEVEYMKREYIVDEVEDLIISINGEESDESDFFLSSDEEQVDEKEVQGGSSSSNLADLGCSAFAQLLSRSSIMRVGTSSTTLPERKFQDATPSNSRGARPVTETTREG